MNPEQRLTELNLELPPPPPPSGAYHPVIQVGNLALVSGHGPVNSDRTMIVGRVGKDLDLEAARRAARQAGLAILSTLRREFGSLDRIKRVVRLLGMVNCTPEFDQHSAVINGCSELFIEVFGKKHGQGVRSAVGMGSLPGNIAVEIEATFELADSEPPPTARRKTRSSTPKRATTKKPSSKRKSAAKRRR